LLTTNVNELLMILSPLVPVDLTLIAYML